MTPSTFQNYVRAFFKTIRIHQWSKNILLFVPLITAHKFSQIPLLRDTFYAFFSFSLCASSVYILNDLNDLEVDRAHPTKKFRPLAAGIFSPIVGRFLVPFFIAGSVGIAFLLPRIFLLLLLVYLAITSAYSLYFKKIVLLDVLVLASLYTIRIFAGAMAIQIPISPWLLAFSMFFFLNLAFVKRFSELHLLHIENSELGKGRGYMGKDLGLVGDMGIASGYVSVLVMALYIQSETVTSLYHHPYLLWFICPLLLYWISRIWLMTRRGLMHDDPILFAIGDKVSYFVGFLVALMVFLAT